MTLTEQTPYRIERRHYHGKTYFWIRHLDAMGCRVRKRAPGATREEAEAWAAQQEDIIRISRVGLLIHHNRRIDAARRLNLHWNDAVEQYLLWIAKNSSAKQIRRKLMAFGKHYNNPCIQDVTPPMLSNWVNDPQGQTKLTTRKGHLGTFRKFFDFASDSGWLRGNPAKLAKVEHRNLPVHLLEKREVKLWTREDIDTALARIAPTHKVTPYGHLRGGPGQWRHNTDYLYQRQTFWRLAILTAWETGARIGDIANLQWESLRECTLVFFTRKSNQRVAVAVSEPLAEEYRQFRDWCQAKTKLCQWVFPQAHEQYESRVLNLQWQRMRQSIGLPSTFHAIRHSKATRLFHEGETPEQIAATLGHSNTDTQSIYIHK